MLRAALRVDNEAALDRPGRNSGEKKGLPFRGSPH
jgi:hypothetical protein